MLPATLPTELATQPVKCADLLSLLPDTTRYECAGQ
jgi:hypothetical protein